MISVSENFFFFRNENLHTLNNILFNNYFADIDECLSNPCMNTGSCIDTEGSYTCQCSPGWTGYSCEQGRYTLIYNFNCFICNY